MLSSTTIRTSIRNLSIILFVAPRFIGYAASQNIFQAIERVYKAESHCCGDLGCFDVVGAFLDLLKRPINPLPSCENHVRFTLKTQDNIDNPDILNPLDIKSINRSHFRNDRDGVKILIHGYIDDGHAPWITSIEPRLLLQGDYNVITADWSTGVSIPYFQAASNTRVVGAEVARLIRVLRTKFGQSYRKIHIIGHSLGAHVAGYASKLERVGRVSGLDPAGIYFADMPSAARLDAGDADFVDTIITDGRDILQLGYGTLQPLGHINFYPNGGREQPGCGKSLVTSIWDNLMGTGGNTGVENDVLGCSHYRASLLYIESVINPACTMIAVRCGSYAEFRSGRCFSCENNNCQTMGLSLMNNRSEAQRGNYYLLTGSSAPYCVRTFRIELSFSSGARTTERGYLKVQIQNENDEADGWESLNLEAVDFHAGETISFAFAGTWNLGGLDKVKAVKLTWTFDYSWRHPFDWLRTHELLIQPTVRMDELNVRDSLMFRTDDGNVKEKETAVFTRV